MGTVAVAVGQTTTEKNVVILSPSILPERQAHHGRRDKSPQREDSLQPSLRLYLLDTFLGPGLELWNSSRSCLGYTERPQHHLRSLHRCSDHILCDIHEIRLGCSTQELPPVR